MSCIYKLNFIISFCGICVCDVFVPVTKNDHKQIKTNQQLFGSRFTAHMLAEHCCLSSLFMMKDTL